MTGVVLVFEDDLLFASRVEAGLRANAYQPRFVTRVDELGEALKAAPVLVLANIDTQTLPWTRLVQLVKDRRPVPNPPVSPTTTLLFIRAP